MVTLVLKFFIKIHLGSRRLIKNLLRDLRKINFDSYEEQLYQKNLELYNQNANDYCRNSLKKTYSC